MTQLSIARYKIYNTKYKNMPILSTMWFFFIIYVYLLAGSIRKRINVLKRVLLYFQYGKYVKIHHKTLLIHWAIGDDEERRCESKRQGGGGGGSQIRCKTVVTIKQYEY